MCHVNIKTHIRRIFQLQKAVMFQGGKKEEDGRRNQKEITVGIRSAMALAEIALDDQKDQRNA